MAMLDSFLGYFELAWGKIARLCLHNSPDNLHFLPRPYRTAPAHEKCSTPCLGTRRPQAQACASRRPSRQAAADAAATAAFGKAFTAPQTTGAKRRCGCCRIERVLSVYFQRRFLHVQCVQRVDLEALGRHIVLAVFLERLRVSGFDFFLFQDRLLRQFGKARLLRGRKR